MGYMFCIGTCIGCGRAFTFAPDLVPSVRPTPTASAEPICAACVERANPIRIANGLEPITVLPGAYDAQEE